MHELRRRFAIEGGDDDVTPVHIDRHWIFVGLPAREGGLLGSYPSSGAGERLFEPTGVNRLQQVVNRVHFECLDGMFVKGRHEDEHGGLLRAFNEAACQFEAAETRHLDVEEHEIRLVRIDGREGLQAIARVRHDLHIIQLLELVTQFVAGQLLVVNDHHSKGGHAVICSAARRSGTSMRAVVPWPGSLVSVSWYVAP